MNARRPSRRGLRRAAWTALAVATALVAAYLARERVLAPLAIRWLADRAARAGFELEIARLSGDWVDAVEVEGLRLRARDAAGELRELAVERATVEVALRELIRGGAHPLERIDARGVSIELDFTAPKRAARGPDRTRELPRWIPRGSATDVSVDARVASDASLHVARAFVLAAPRAGGASFTADLGHVRAEIGERTLECTGAARGAIDGRALSVAELALAGDLEARLDGSRAELAREGGVDWDLVARAWGGELRAVGGTRGGATRSTVEVEGVDVAAILGVVRPCGGITVQGRLDSAGVLEGRAGSFVLRSSAAAAGIRVASFELDGAAGEVEWRRGEIGLARLEALASFGALTAESASVRLDARDWIEALRTARGRVAVDVADLAELRAAVAVATGVSLRALEESEPFAAQRAQLAGVLGPTGIDLERGRLVARGGALSLERGRIAWSDDPARTLTDSRIDFDLAAAFDDLASIGALAGSSGWSGAVRGRLHFAGTLGEPEGVLVLSGHDVAAFGWPLGLVSLGADVDAERLRIRTLSTDGPLGSLELEGDFELGTRAFRAAQLRAQLDDLGGILPRVFDAGSAEVAATFHGTLDDPIGSFEVAGRDLAFAGAGAPLFESVAIRGDHSDGVFRLVELRAEAACTQLAASGSLRHERALAPLDLVLDRIALSRGALALASTAPLALRLERDPSGVLAVSGGLALAGTAGEIELSGRWSRGDVAGEVRCRDLDPMPALAFFVPPGVEVEGVGSDLHVELRGGALEIVGELDARAVRLQPELPPLALRASGAIGGGRARVDDFALRLSADSFAAGSFDLPFEPSDGEPFPGGEVLVEARARIARLEDLPWRALGLGVDCAGSVDASVELAGASDALTGTAEIRARDLVGSRGAGIDALGGRKLGPAAIDARAVLGEGLRIERCEILAPAQVRASLTGTLAAPREATRLFDGAAWRAAALDLAAEIEAENLDFVRAWSPALRRVGGRLRLSGGVKGTLDEPDLAGAVELSEGELRFAGAQRGIDSIEGRARLAGSRLEVEHLRGELGGGTLDFAGEIDLAGEEPRLDLDLTGRALPLVRTDSLRLRADATLTVEGPWSRLSIGGELALRDSRYSHTVELLEVLDPRRERPRASRAIFDLFSFEHEPLASARLDVAVVAVEPFQLDTNLARIAMWPDLRLTGTGWSPLLTGTTTCEPTRVFLPTARLELVSGSTVWTRSEPLVPRLEMFLTTRIAGYDVKVEITGPYDQREVALTSVPPASHEDLILMLATGEPPRESLTERGRLAAARRVATYVGRDIVSRWLAGPDEEESFFDRLELETGAEETRSGSSTADVRYRLRGDLTGPGQSVWLRAERDRYDAVNWGVRFVFRRK